MELVDSVDDFQSSHSIQGNTHFPIFEMLDARIASSLNKIIQEFLLQEQGQFGGTESSERGSVTSLKTHRLHDPTTTSGFMVLMIPFLVTLIHSHFNLRNDDVQEFDSRWNEILLSMSKIPPDDILESLYKLRIRESDQLKTPLELYDLEIHQKISKARLSKIENDGEEKRRSETQTAVLRRQKKGRWLRIAGVNVVWKEDQENAINGKEKDSVREEIVAVSDTMRISVQNRHQSPPLNHRHKRMVEGF